MALHTEMEIGGYAYVFGASGGSISEIGAAERDTIGIARRYPARGWIFE